jgi:uncharacterized membrane protein YeaQ/YmgE (transglycosylase-associated protein family)
MTLGAFEHRTGRAEIVAEIVGGNAAGAAQLRRPVDVEQGMVMNASFVILWGVVGAVIGWLAGQIMEKGKLGGHNDVLVGLGAAVVGGWAFPEVFGFLLGGQQSPVLGHIVNAALGAVVGTFAARYYMEYQAKADTSSKSR